MGQYHSLAVRVLRSNVPRGGIDISKDTLDVHCLSDGEHTQFLNSKTGHVQLTKWIGLQQASVIIFEATDAYHRQLEQALWF